jgi:hypothetical protein
MDPTEQTPRGKGRKGSASRQKASAPARDRKRTARRRKASASDLPDIRPGQVEPPPPEVPGPKTALQSKVDTLIGLLAETRPAESAGIPSHARPVANPSDATPVVNPSDAPPIADPSDATPVVNPSDAPPIADPSDATPVVNPSDAPPIADPQSASPATHALHKEMLWCISSLEVAMAALPSRRQGVDEDSPLEPIRFGPFSESDRQAVENSIALLKTQPPEPTEPPIEALEAAQLLRAVGTRRWDAAPFTQGDTFLPASKSARSPLWLARHISALADAAIHWINSLKPPF